MDEKNYLLRLSEGEKVELRSLVHEVIVRRRSCGLSDRSDKSNLLFDLLRKIDGTAEENPTTIQREVYHIRVR